MNNGRKENLENNKLILEAQNNPEALERAIQLNMGLIYQIVYRIYNKLGKYRRVIDPNDLISEAKIALMEAILKYNPQKSKFGYYANLWIKGHLYRFIQRETNFYNQVDLTLDDDKKSESIKDFLPVEDNLEDNNELSRIIRESQLGTRDAEILELYFCKGYSFRSIAQQMNMSIEGIRQIVLRKGRIIYEKLEK